ncbi:MAG: hypothetical protein E7211_18570 [Clostridium lundense]|nr:hypothetical protein [Clostridium lundense]
MIPNHISSLGFLQDDDTFCKYVVTLIQSPPESMDLYRFEHSKGQRYVLCRDGEPIEIWYYFVKDKSEILDDFFLAYQGTHYIKATPRRWVDIPEWNGPQLLRIVTNEEIEDLPFNAMICTPPEIVELGKTRKICLVCISTDIQEYDGDGGYEIEGIRFAKESLIPAGTLPPEGWDDNCADDYEQASTIIMGAKVTEAEVRKNTITGNDYYWMCVQCLSLELEVVAAMDLLDELPKVGNYVHGQFEVLGHLAFD